MSLPWEANPDYFASSLSPAACSLVQVGSKNSNISTRAVRPQGAA